MEAGSSVVATLTLAEDSLFASLKLVSGVNDCFTFDEFDDIIAFDFFGDGNGNYTVSAQLDAGEYALIVEGREVTKCGKIPYFLELNKLSLDNI